MHSSINVTIGTPGQQISLQLDTGSADLWVPGSGSNACTSKTGCPYGSFDASKSSSFTQLTQDGFNISYDEPGDFDAGFYFSDIIKFGSATLENITIGLATYAADNNGLMGVGMQSLESIVQTGESNTGYPTVVGALLDAGLIERAAFSLWLNDLNANAGSILFGGVDTDKYTGDLISLPIQIDADAQIFDRYLVTLTSVSINDDSGTHLLSDSSLSVAALLDSGTTSSILPADIASAIWGGLGANTAGEAQNEILVPCNLAKSNATLSFGFGGEGGPVINVPISEIINNEGIKAGSTYENGDAICSLYIDSQTDDPSGSVILGDSFLRSAYVVYDLENNEIAIAQTNYNSTSSNIQPIPSGSGLPGVSSSATAAAPTAAVTELPAPAGGANTAVASDNPGTPTFALGSAATAVSTGGSSSGSGTKSGAVATAAFEPFTFGMSMIFGVATLFAAMLL